MKKIRLLLIRVKIWLVEKDILVAEECSNRLRKDLPDLHLKRSRLLSEYWGMQ